MPIRPLLPAFFAFCSLCDTASASTQALFSQDGAKATVLVLGRPGDPDPAAFYQALRVPEEDFQGKRSKKLSLSTPEGARALDVACIFSRMFPDNGTCTVVLHSVPGLVTVSRAEGKARLWLQGEAARDFSRVFETREESTLIFRSQDGRFNISTARDRGVISDFVIDWNGRGLF